MNFDFDEWATLHQQNPAEFEKRRRAVMEDIIASAPMSDEAKQRIRTAVLAAPASSDPMENMMSAQRLMWQSFSELQGQMKELHVAQGQDGQISIRRTAVAQFTK